MKDVIRVIHDKLPILYQVFSLHVGTGNEFGQRNVRKIEWLGSQLDLDSIKKAFPKNQIFYRYGNAYLVYQDGRKKEL